MSGPGLPAGLCRFLGAPTPAAWAEAALAGLSVLLVDHANCEKKAAASAIALMNRYPERGDLVYRLSRLAREELRHFEQVRAMIQRLGFEWRHVPASRYAAGLREIVDREEPGRLVDSLLVGAFIEARSAERFALLVPRLSGPLGALYRGLLASEARHYEQYLSLARACRGAMDEEQFAARIASIRATENELVTAPDPTLRFHSGLPAELPVSAAG